MSSSLESRSIIGMRVDATSYNDAVDRVMSWTGGSVGRYVCVANVHMCMESYDDSDFSDVVNGANLVTPDGMPLVWGLRFLGVDTATRVRGPNLMLHICEEAARLKMPIGLYGGTEESLQGLIHFLKDQYEGIEIAVAISPPFRALTKDEDATYRNDINKSGAKILFVGIGCPKQENWMASHKEYLSCVMLGVGAAFDIYSGITKEAPIWMQNMGLEWLYRLATNPRRLWKRYLKHNPRFIFFLLLQLLNSRRKPN